jgi:hypothetical protein
METKVIEKQETINFETPAETAPLEVAHIQPELQEIPAVQGTFGDKTSFEHAQRVAKMLSSSSLIPKEFQGNMQNTMIALEMANRIGASPLMVMQNLYIVHGKPSWSSTFIIASINASGKFSPLRFEVGGEGDQYGCYAWAYDLANNERLIGPKVTLAMANAEGWVNKAGSKWKTMPELMMRYRAAAFFGRLFAPEIMMGMQSMEEAQDVQVTTVTTEQKIDALNAKLQKIQNGESS